MDDCVAVFDLGKTNMKVVVFDAAGKVLAERGVAQCVGRARRALAVPAALHRGRLGVPDRSAEGTRG